MNGRVTGKIPVAGDRYELTRVEGAGVVWSRIEVIGVSCGYVCVEFLDRPAHPLVGGNVREWIALAHFTYPQTNVKPT